MDASGEEWRRESGLRGNTLYVISTWIWRYLTVNGNSGRGMGQLERRSSSGAVSVLQRLHMNEWCCMDEDWGGMTMRTYSLPNLGMKRGRRDDSVIGIEWRNRWNDTERVPLYHQRLQEECWGFHSSRERNERKSDVRWIGCCEGRVRSLFYETWNEEWWVERRWILMSRVWIERLVSSPPRVFSSILHDSRREQRVSTVLTETALFWAQQAPHGVLYPFG